METLPIESLNSDQLRELVLQALAQLVMKENMTMIELVDDLRADLIEYQQELGPHLN